MYNDINQEGALNTLKDIKKILVCAFVLFAMTLNSVAIAETPAELYDNVWSLINKKYVDVTDNSQDWSRWRSKYDNRLKTPEDAYVAIDTMLGSLNDPYTRYLDPKEFADE